MIRGTGECDVAVLIASRNRPDLLLERAIQSIANQSLLPRAVVVVNDGAPWASSEKNNIKNRLAGLDVMTIHNARSQGVGGAWNTGISHLINHTKHKGFIAILDDDDLWESDHIAENYAAALDRNANIVVSGLRIRSDIGDIPRPLINSLNVRDFLTGNPGWQGSNTFVETSMLEAVGGFRESLSSLHDRDLAIRLLRHQRARALLLPKWTATWCIDRPGRLSDYRGQAKLDGLRCFWRLYAAEMSVSERRAFLDRAEQLFGFSDDEIGSAVVLEQFQKAYTGDLYA